MSIARKVRSVQRLFDRLDKEIIQLRDDTGIHCIPGCGHCCTKLDIEASTLEFLPFAFEVFKTGMATEMIERLQSNQSPVCLLYAPLSLNQQTSGSCGEYMHRGLICRLFGFAASRDKHGNNRLVTCKEIKEKQPVQVQAVNDKIASNEKIPVFTYYYQQLSCIDFRLANQMLPINKAIEEALKEVLHYYAYRPFRPLRKSG